MSKRRKIVHAVITDPSGRFLILKRVPNEYDKVGLWDLPGGSVEPGEHPVAAVIREIHEECGIPGAITGFICRYEWPHYAKPSVILECECYRAILVPSPPECRIRVNASEHTQARWVSRWELDQYEFLSATKANMDKLFGELGA